MTDQKRGPGRPGRTVDPKNYSIIARNIDKRMTDIGMPTKVELARVSEVSRTVITNIFIMPNKGVMGDSAVKLAKALKCRVEWLITGEGPVSDEDIIGVPVFNINKLVDTPIEEALESITREIQRIPSPHGYSKSSFGIWLDSNINFESCKKYEKFERSGVMFFDHGRVAVGGDLVLVKTSPDSTPEIMECFMVRDMMFVSSLNDNLPDSYRSIELSDGMEVLGVNTGYSIKTKP